MTIAPRMPERGQSFARNALRVARKALDVFEGKDVGDVTDSLEGAFHVLKNWHYDFTHLPRGKDGGGLLETYAQPVYRAFDTALEASRPDLHEDITTKKKFFEAVQRLMQQHSNAKPLQDEVTAFVARILNRYQRTVAVSVAEVETKLTKEAFCAFLQRAVVELEKLQK